MDAKAAAAFVVPYARAVVKLRAAVDAGTGVELAADEVAALVDALRTLAAGPPGRA